MFATVFTAELTHPPPPIWGMLLLAAVGAHWVRLLAGPRRRPANRTAPSHTSNIANADGLA
jgi:H+/Cl- antiporter ClcA